MKLKKITAKHLAKKYAIVTLGSLLFSLGVCVFYNPNDLVTGGVTGIAMMLNRFVPMQIGTLIFIINIPLLIVAFWKFGWRFLVSTFYAIICVSLFTNLFDYLPAATEEPILAAFGGSVLTALGLGLVFRMGSTTGGTDIIVRLLKMKYPHMKTGALIFIVDMVIVGASAIVFGTLDRALYAAIALVCATFVTDFVLYGRDGAKLLFIICKESEPVAKAFLEELHVGVTFLDGRGAYSNKDTEILMCVIKKTKYPQAEELVKEIAPEAFLIVSSASEIYGLGYKDIYEEKY